MAIIGFCSSIITTIITNNSTNRKVQEQLTTNNAVINVRIDELTKEMNRHNSFVEEIPVLKYRLEQSEKEIVELKKSQIIKK